MLQKERKGLAGLVDITYLVLVETDVERAHHDWLEHDAQVLSLPHPQQQLRMSQLGEDPELPGQGGPAALPQGHPAASPPVGSHVCVVTGAVAGQVAVVSLQLRPADHHHTRHLSFLRLSGELST